MKTLFSFIFVLASFSFLQAQYDPNYIPEEEPSFLNFGLGIGLSYGGIGARLEVVPVKNFAIFGSAGFNFHQLGYNAGGIIRILPDKKACPILMGMYGYNGVIIVIGTDQYNETYYGPSIGAGVEIKVGRNQNFMEAGLIIPFRPQEFTDDMNNIRNQGIQISDPLPFAVSFGYHFKF